MPYLLFVHTEKSKACLYLQQSCNEQSIMSVLSCKNNYAMTKVLFSLVSAPAKSSCPSVFSFKKLWHPLKAQRKETLCRKKWGSMGLSSDLFKFNNQERSCGGTSFGQGYICPIMMMVDTSFKKCSAICFQLPSNH